MMNKAASKFGLKELLFTSTGPASILTAGLLGNRVSLSAETSSLIFYATAGLVLVALAHDIMPSVVDIEPEGPTAPSTTLRRITALSGIGVALIMMLAVEKEFGSSKRPPTSEEQISGSGPGGMVMLADYHNPPGTEPYPLPAVLAAGLDIFIDGILTGMSVGLGDTSLPLAAALAIENGMLSLAMVEKMKATHVGEAERLYTVLGLTAGSAAGNLVGVLGGRRFSKTSLPITGMMGFATVVVTWLIVQELMPEAHRVEKTRLSGPAMFFAGLTGGAVLEWIGG